MRDTGMVVTRSRWDLYLPDRFRYGAPTTNLDVVGNGARMSREAMRAGMSLDRSPAPQQLAPLEIEVPSAGVHFAFEKLYANQAEDDAFFSIPYTSGTGATIGHAVSLLGTLLFWTGLWQAWRREPPLAGRLALAGTGLVMLLAPIGYLQTSAALPLVISALALVAFGAWQQRERLPFAPGGGAATG